MIACPTYDDKAKADLVKGYLTYVFGTEGQSRRRRDRRLRPASTDFGKDAVAARRDDHRTMTVQS